MLAEAAPPSPPSAGSKRGRTAASPASPSASSPRTPTPRLIFATASGAIGALISLPDSVFSLLLRAQAAMGAVLPGVGGLRHDAWRAGHSEKRPPGPLALGDACVGPRGVVDGDFLESLLHAPREAQEAVAAAMGAGGGGGGGEEEEGDGEADTKGQRQKKALGRLLEVLEGLAAMH